jgi:hypothetical protein
MGEREDLIEAVRVLASEYNPCDQCGAPAAELWHWSGGLEEGDELAAYCPPCAEAAGVAVECVPAEPEAHIAAISKVRHLIAPATPIRSEAKEG